MQTEIQPPAVVGAVRWAAATALVCAVVVGCALSTASTDLSAACPKIYTSRQVPVCTQLFESGPGLRVPAGTDQEPIGAVSRGGAFFIDTRGRKLGMPPIKRPTSTIDRGYATTVYRAQADGGVVKSLEPILRVSDNAILTRIFGGHLLTGTISARLPDGSYDIRPKLPVVVRLAEQAQDQALYGSIVNADRAVRINNGKCVAALPGAPDNPLVDGFNSNVHLARVPSMHLPYGDQLVLQWSASSSGMGDSYYPSVATVMGHDALGKQWQVVQHGNPTSGPALNLRLASGAVATC